MYYQNEPRFNGVYSRDNLPDKIKDGAYVINLDGYSVLGLSTFQKKKTKKKNNKRYAGKFTIVTNIFRTKACDSVMCGYFCIKFIDFMLKGHSSIDFTNLFSPNNFKKNDDIGLNYFLTNL